MFRIAPRDAHAWQDIALNIGKLSLAGLFLAGTVFIGHAYAEKTAQRTVQSIDRIQTFSFH